MLFLLAKKPLIQRLFCIQHCGALNIIGTVALFFALAACSGQRVPTAADIDPSAQPEQNAVREQVVQQVRDGAKIIALADYTLHAHVLSTERYRMGAEADYSPVDWAVAWGPVADPTVIKQLRIMQASRYYAWRVDTLPLPQKTMNDNMANVHIVPANSAVRELALAIEKGDRIRAKGKLVRIERADGWRWVSSLTREDSGGGACELFWVESIERVK
jgi:hypothetical protein